MRIRASALPGTASSLHIHNVKLSVPSCLLSCRHSLLALAVPQPKVPVPITNYCNNCKMRLVALLGLFLRLLKDPLLASTELSFCLTNKQQLSFQPGHQDISYLGFQNPMPALNNLSDIRDLPFLYLKSEKSLWLPHRSINPSLLPF